MGYWTQKSAFRIKPRLLFFKNSSFLLHLQYENNKVSCNFCLVVFGDFAPMPGKSRHGIYVGPSVVQMNGFFLNFSHQNFWRLHSLPLGLGLWLVEVRKNHKKIKALFQNCSMTFSHAQGPKWCYRRSHKQAAYLYRGSDDLPSGIFLASLRKWVPKSTTVQMNCQHFQNGLL